MQWWKRSRQAARGRSISDECQKRRACVATMAGRATPRMRKALPWVGRHTERAWVCLGWFHPASRVGACRNLRQGSGVHTHRQVVAGSVCRGIVMCAAINAMLRQPALLLQFAGPSLRRAVTALSVSRRAQRPQPCSTMRVTRGCWQHSAVSHAPDDLPDGQRWRLQHAPDLIQSKAPVSTVLQTGREPIAVATHSLNIVSIKKSWAQY